MQSPRSIEELRSIPMERWGSELSRDEAQLLLAAELEGHGGEMPAEVVQMREKSLDSPAYMATEILDPEFYGKKFEPVHYQWLDEVMGPWAVGETVRWQGSNYDPRQYTGLIILGSRGMLKSTMLRILLQWYFPYIKLRGTPENGKEDGRVMLAHHVIEKAVEHSEAIRNCARSHPRWRECFPEFCAPKGEWDTKGKWRWPNFAAGMATESSLVCYGETSSKVGGHYTFRGYDDWVDEDSVTNANQLEDSYQRFVKMDNLRDRTREYNPQMAAGTHYHYQDTYKRLEDQGGWMVLRMPAHSGSPKRIFEIATMPSSTAKDLRKIKVATERLKADPPGALNFPKLIPWEECIRSARAQGANNYNTQLLLNPMPEGEQRFNRDVLDSSWRDTIPTPEDMWIYVRVDPAISEKRSADECTIVVGGVTWNGQRWLLDGWVGREKRPNEIVRKIFFKALGWKSRGYVVQNIGIESVAYQEALAQLCRDGVPEREPTYNGEMIPMMTKPCAIRSIQRKSNATKHERILEMDGPTSRGDVLIWSENPIGSRTLDQFKNFPFDRYDILDATHDLWVDAICPPRSISKEYDGAPIEWIKAMQRHKKKHKKQNGVIGTNNTVRLTAWGG